MRVGICDDNTNELKAMQALFRRTAPDYNVDTYSDGGELLRAVSEGTGYDLLFLDILMPQITGMELARELHRIAPDTPVVFLTDSDAYAVEAFSIEALHYILKPMTEPALKECLRRLEERQGARKRIHIISSSGVQQMLFADEIQYAQSDAHYYDVHMKDGTVIKARMTQTEIQNTLGDAFLLISRGLLVNVEFIRQLRPKSCVLKDGREILLSRKNADEIHAAYADYVFSRISRRAF